MTATPQPFSLLALLALIALAWLAWRSGEAGSPAYCKSGSPGSAAVILNCPR